MKRIVLAATLAIAAIASAHAGTINGLVNTGVGGGVQDFNYALTSVPSDSGITSTFGYISSGSGFPFDYWSANDATSKWITPAASAAQSFDANRDGTYTYELTFNLTGYNASTAAFAGKFAADNSAIVMLNGTKIGAVNGFGGFGADGFSATGSEFKSGLNTLDFVVTNFALNGGNPTGLRVEFTSSSVMAAVPEPETYGMLLAGLGMMGVIARRRRQAK
ncbi:PEP-CTERM sorting domain-containing protein [Rugamonas sp.]|uniref:PEP-CTERM sorting domain-containing protein n=1 Tax=Rugamonas sp. TaxID=1926287 RepID=UPI0025FB156D|nr:PEP-CTERM sorting domain-containing protein [Rugamonas sp.]